MISNRTWFSFSQKFYERGIMMLSERWQKVIDQNITEHYIGQHITEYIKVI